MSDATQAAPLPAIEAVAVVLAVEMAGGRRFHLESAELPDLDLTGEESAGSKARVEAAVRGLLAALPPGELAVEVLAGPLLRRADGSREFATGSASYRKAGLDRAELEKSAGRHAHGTLAILKMVLRAEAGAAKSG